MEELKKELAEMNKTPSKMLAIKQKEFDLKYIKPFTGPQTKSISQNHYQN